MDGDFYKSVIEDVKYGVLPEIIGKWYTRKPVADCNGVVPLPSPSTAAKNPDGCSEQTVDYS